MSPRSQKYGASASAMRSSGYGYPQHEQEEEEEEEQPQQRRSYGSTGRRNVQQQQPRHYQEDDDDDEEDHYYQSNAAKKVGYPKPTVPTSSGRFSQNHPLRTSTNSNNIAMKGAGSSRMSTGSHVREMENGWKNTMDDPPYSSRSAPKTNSSYRDDDYDVADRYQSNNPLSTRNAGLVSRREVPVRSTSGRFPSEPVVPQLGSSSIRGAANIPVPSSRNRPNDPVRFNSNSSRR
jgi:hypothetical protein